MGCSQNMVPSSVNTFCLQLCRLAPQEKHHIPLLTVYGAYGSICELLPASLGVRVCLVRPHSQAHIQEQHTLLGPLQEQTPTITEVAKLTIEARIQGLCLYKARGTMPEDDANHTVRITAIGMIGGRVTASC